MMKDFGCESMDNIVLLRDDILDIQLEINIIVNHVLSSRQVLLQDGERPVSAFRLYNKRLKKLVYLSSCVSAGLA